jgi:uncharacterized DUF497 family protein
LAIVYDPKKNERNIRERGLSFDRVAELDFTTALIEAGTRRDYGERRMRALAFLDGRLHAVVYVHVDADTRVISFRRASQKEGKRYASTKGQS